MDLRDFRFVVSVVCCLTLFGSACVEPNQGETDPELSDMAVIQDAAATPNSRDGHVVHLDAASPSEFDRMIKINEVECRGSEWVELFNSGDQVVDISGWLISDKLDSDAASFEIRPVQIEPGAFWTSGDEQELPFRIKCDGETIFLRHSSGQLIDAIDVLDPPRGLTWGRLPDGVGDGQTTQSTPGASNRRPVAVSLRLNEIDCRGRDRVEIVNTGTGPADLSGWRLTDSADDEERVFELDGVVEPAGFQVFRQQNQEDVGFRFGIGCDDDTVTLLRPDGTVEDQVEMRATPAAFNLGRLPNGEGDWTETQPTLGESNRPPAGDESRPFGSMEVLEIDLTVDEAGLDSLRAEPRAYVPATFSVSGSMDRPMAVGLRIKGRIGSLRDLDEKPAWKIKFDFLEDGQRFAGLERLTMNNMVQDPSQIHEWAAYRLFRAQGLPAPRLGYAFVRLNGSIYGVYALIETPDEHMLGRWYPETLHVYEGAYGQDLLGNRIEDFEIDSGDPVDRSDLYLLQQMLDSLPPNEFFEATETLVDWPKVIGTMATEIYIGHWDGYAPTRNNYYFHFDGNGALSLLPWGTDQTFNNQINFFGGRGRLLQACLSSGACRFQFEEALVRVMETVESLSLMEAIEALAERLTPWQEIDDRSGRRPEQIANQVQRTVDFLAERAEVAQEVLSCLLSDDPDPDGDGFRCSADCDNQNPEVYPGAPEVCGDGIDQDCNGRVDDGRDCPDCTPMMAGEHRYLVCTEQRTYAEAVTHCEENGSAPIIIQSAAENNWVRRMARQIIPQNFWLGATDLDDEGTWVWSDGTDLDGYSNWRETEPNGGENENCLQVFASGGAWIDISCEARLSVLCEDPCPESVDADGDGYNACAGDCDDSDPDRSPDAAEVCYDGVDNNCDGNFDEGGTCRCISRFRAGRTYLFCLNDRVSWPDADRTCRELNGGLLTISDEAENDWLLAQIRSFGGHVWWMGLSDREEEGQFEWVDGSDLEYTHWNQDEPNDWRASEDCGTFLDNGFWNDARCVNQNRFICEL